MYLCMAQTKLSMVKWEGSLYRFWKKKTNRIRNWLGLFRLPPSQINKQVYDMLLNQYEIGEGGGGGGGGVRDWVFHVFHVKWLSADDIEVCHHCHINMEMHHAYSTMFYKVNRFTHMHECTWETMQQQNKVHRAFACSHCLVKINSKSSCRNEQT